MEITNKQLGNWIDGHFSRINWLKSQLGEYYLTKVDEKLQSLG